MTEQDNEQLTLFPEEYHANHSQSPGNDEARKMTVTSGQRCFELYRNSARCGLLSKMLLESSIWHSTRCYLTWKASVTKDRRLLFRLVVSMPHTNESASVLWPTPSTGAALCGGTGNFKTLKKMAEKGLITEEERKQFSQGNGGKTNPQLLEWLMGYEQQFTKLIPTPISTDYKGGALNRYFGGGNYDSVLRSFLELTPRGKIGLMNPNWTEWLMGYPIGWTELNASEMQ